MKCPQCGRESGEGKNFCEWCGSRLPQRNQVYYVSPADDIYVKQAMSRGLKLVLLGVVVSIIGGVVYGLVISSIANSSSEWSSDPWGTDTDPFIDAMGSLLAAYAIVGLGSLLVIIGVVLIAIDKK